MATETQPTIADLWDRFQKLGNYIETEKILQSWGTKGSDGLSHDGRNHLSDEIELNALRQELLERCANEYGLALAGLMVWHDPKKVGWNGPKNYGSAWMFMDWELEQREKEATNG